MFFRHWDGRILMKLNQIQRVARCHHLLSAPSPLFIHDSRWTSSQRSINMLPGRHVLLQNWGLLAWMLAWRTPLAKCTDHIGPLHVVPLGISESTCYRGQCSVFRELSTPTIQFQARQFPTPDADLFPLTLMRWLEVIPVIITPPSTNRGWGKSCKLIASVSEFKLRCPLHFWLRASLSCQLWYFSNQKTAIWCQINIHKPISGSHSPLESRVSRFLRIVVAAAPCQAAPCHPISHLHLLSKTALLRGCQCLFAQRHGKLWRMERVKNLGIANI